MEVVLKAGKAEQEPRVIWSLPGDDPLVWDTSALWSAFEDLSDSLRSGLKQEWLRERAGKSFGSPIKLLERRLKQIDPAAKFLMGECLRRTCLIPVTIAQESVRKDRRVAFLFDDDECRRVEREKGIPNYCSNLRRMLRIFLDDASDETKRNVTRMGRITGIELQKEHTEREKYADYDAIALALERNGILVTADRKQAELALSLGARVIYLPGF